MQLEDALVVKFLLLAHSAETVAWSYLGPSDFDYLAPGGGFPAAFRRLRYAGSERLVRRHSKPEFF